ncbi:hypothetical protein [Neisseria sp. 83E34]|uniref:hypothetical protein n=1 Tax=Neisseria sp. 83E34 TaxID=1692264 RepID=UPI0006CE7FA1|nr:hypothetical protein [Neisseria sp. 83E34]KPN72665.1 hypothetical protein AKG09_02230 [Neisseria sp. 83E34]
MENSQETNENRFEKIAIAIVYGSIFITQNLLIFCILCVLFSGWQLWKHYHEIVKKFEWTWKVFVTSAVALFLAKISATHHFNNKYGIYPEHLDHSVAVWTVITACTYLTLPVLWNSLKFLAISINEKSVLKSLKYGIHSGTFIIMWWLLIMAHNQAANMTDGCFCWMLTAIRIVGQAKPALPSVKTTKPAIGSS